MVIPGRVEHGVVVLEGGASLPEGTEVTVVVGAASVEPIDESPERPLRAGEVAQPSESKRWSRQDARAALKEILAIPNENPSDTFSGADHDRALYGEPE